MTEYTFITGNENKAREFSEIVGIDVPHQKVDVPEIQSDSLEEISKAKAVSAFEVLKKPVIIEDVSMELDALGGMPGPFIKFFITAIGPKGISDTARALGNDKARVRINYVLYDGKDFNIFANTVEGSISSEPRGESGFGFDPVFIPEGLNKTYAEMSSEEKNKVSHRRKPIQEIAEFLKNT